MLSLLKKSSLCFFILLCLSSFAKAQGISSGGKLFVIPDIQISQIEDDLVSAKEKGLWQAKQQAVQKIFTRLTGKQNGINLPEVSALEEMIARVRLSDETFGGNTYLAKATISLKPKLVERYLRRLNIPFASEQSPKLLLIPNTKIAEEEYLWDIENYWFNLWRLHLANPQSKGEIAQLRLPEIGDPELQLWQLSAAQQYAQKWQEKYQTAEVYQVSLQFPDGFDAEEQFTLIQQTFSKNTFSEASEASGIAEDNHDETEFPSVFLRVALTRINQEADEDVFYEKLYFTIEAEKSGVYNFIPLIEEIHAKISQRWLQKLISEAGDKSFQKTIHLRVHTSDLQQWLSLKKALSASSSVRRFQPSFITPIESEMMVEFSGNFKVLRRQLSLYGWELHQQDSNASEELYLVTKDET